MHHILKDPVMACLNAVTMRLTSVALESPRFVFSLRKLVGLDIPRDPTFTVTRLAVHPAS